MNILGPKIKPELAAELIKLVKTPEDLFGPSGLLQEIKKSLMEKLLEVEMDDHLGYDKGEKQAEGQRANSRNGHTEKTVHTESGSVEIRVPRDCRRRRRRVPLSAGSPVPRDPGAGAEAVPRLSLPRREARG